MKIICTDRVSVKLYFGAFMPKQLSCGNATIYGAFAAYVVGNQRELDMLEVRLSASSFIITYNL